MTGQIHTLTAQAAIDELHRTAARRRTATSRRQSDRPSRRTAFAVRLHLAPRAA
jgi:hypothetical protein